MKVLPRTLASLPVRIVLLSYLSLAVAAAEDANSADIAAAAVQSEVEAITRAKDAVRSGRHDDADGLLRGKGKGEFEHKSDGAVIARRAAAVCGWLQNENEYGRAIKLAERTIRHLAKMNERSDADRAERLYWEAWLTAEVLDRKSDAIALLREAEKLAPEDERVTDLALRLVSAVNEFGR
jgi:tetratricopeptide (TPR) repeat protein